MKKITSEKEIQDKIEIVKQTSIEKKTVFLGTVKPKRGHRMFEYNHKEKTIVEAVFDALPVLKFEDAKTGMQSLMIDW